jgi:hypothetical protein
VFDSQVEVLNIEIEVREDQFVFDKLPDDAGHLVPVHLDDGFGYFDFIHGSIKKNGDQLVPVD